MKKICLHFLQFDVKHDTSVNFLQLNPLISVKHLVLIEKKVLVFDSDFNEMSFHKVYQLLPLTFPNLERLEVKLISEKQMSLVPKMAQKIHLTVSLDEKSEKVKV